MFELHLITTPHLALDGAQDSDLLAEGIEEVS